MTRLRCKRCGALFQPQPDTIVWCGECRRETTPEATHVERIADDWRHHADVMHDEEG